MLQILHNLINNVTPIEGLSEVSNNNFVIDYINEPTENQLNNINDIISAWPLTKNKISKIEKLDSLWENITESGWETSYGWKLGLTINDVTLLTGAFVLAKEASSLGLNNPVSIIDTEGLSHELSLQDLTSLMLQYGNARAQLSSKYANVKSQINNLLSIEEVENFDIELAFDNE
jgi:hypothetical protein